MSDLATPASQPPPDATFAVSAASTAPERLAIRFTGAGGEYFRIWIVNLLLTIVTLGIWSAWAKVRRTRYFFVNTQVGGAAFQYHGNPLAILRGRILAAVLFVAYSVAGRISLGAGLVAATVLALIAPWLFFKAMSFQLANTSWRGLRFGFDSTAGKAYATFAPALVPALLVIAATLSLQRIEPGEKPNPLPLLLAEGLLLVLVPYLHERFKRWQHRAARWGTLAFDFQPSTGAFYGLYAKTFLVALPFFLLFVGVGVGLYWLFKPGTGPGPQVVKAGLVPMMIAMYASVLVAYLFVGAFFVSRLQRLVWTRTHAGPLRFSTTVTAGGFMRVWFVNGFLTLITVGLYWPWMAVAIARYRLESTAVEAAAPIEQIAASNLPVERSTTGEGAVDFFGWDLGL